MHVAHIPFMITIVWMHIRDFLPKLRPLLIRFHVYDKINNWIEFKMSRKLTLLYIVLVLATVGAFIPPIITWALNLYGKNAPPFEILGSTEWVSMISLVVSTYFGSNVWEKHVAISNGVQPSQLDNACKIIKGSPGAIQPVPVQTNFTQQQQGDLDKDALKNSLTHDK